MGTNPKGRERILQRVRMGSLFLYRNVSVRSSSRRESPEGEVPERFPYKTRVNRPRKTDTRAQYHICASDRASVEMAGKEEFLSKKYEKWNKFEVRAVTSGV